jgi:hypothetical protein
VANLKLLDQLTRASKLLIGLDPYGRDGDTPAAGCGFIKIYFLIDQERPNQVGFFNRNIIEAKGKFGHEESSITNSGHHTVKPETDQLLVCFR